MITKENIIKIVENYLNNSEKFIVEVSVETKRKITVFLDCAQGNITIEDCQTVSRHLYEQLLPEVEDYELEVSSAGLTKPLKLLKQYIKNIGKEINVVLTTGEKYTGTLKNVDENKIVVELNKKKKSEITENMTFLFEEIKQTKLVIKF